MLDWSDGHNCRDPKGKLNSTYCFQMTEKQNQQQKKGEKKNQPQTNKKTLNQYFLPHREVSNNITDEEHLLSLEEDLDAIRLHCLLQGER